MVVSGDLFPHKAHFVEKMHKLQFMKLEGWQGLWLLLNFQGIVHLVIGSLGADPITTGDYYGIKLEHVNTNECFWLNSKITIGEVRGKHEALYPADEWK